MSAALPIVPHQPYPIADMDVGLYQAKEPWLSPAAAFTSLRDAYVYRSRLLRRKGFKAFATCGVASASSLNKNTSLTPRITYTLNTATTKIVGESVQVSWTDPVNGSITGDVPGLSFGLQDILGSTPWGWPIYATGTTTQIGFVQQSYSVVGGSNLGAAAIVDWSLHPDHTGADGTGGTMTWEEDPRLPITGLTAYRDTTGAEYLIAMNTKRLFLYDASEGYFDDSVGSDTFTGSDDDLFWTWPLGDFLVVTNGVDAIRKYTGSTDTLATMTTTIGAGPAEVDSAQIAFEFRGRLLYGNTVENGTSHPGRLRFTRANAFETLDTEDFVDAPSSLGSMTTAKFIGPRVLVGFTNGWLEVVYTGDPRQLYRFEPTTSTFGTVAKLGAIQDRERIIARTLNGIEAVDPNGQYPVDDAIPDYVLDTLDPGNDEFTVGFRNIPEKQLWFSAINTLAPTASPNELLVAQYQEDRRFRWSTFDVPFVAFADFRQEASENWDDIDINWDDFDVVWDSAATVAGFPLTLAGSANGRIYQYGGSQDHLDDRPYNTVAIVDREVIGPQSIPFEAKTIQISPIPNARTHLGWVDFYLESSPGVTLTIEFRGNTSSAAYLIRTIDLEPTSASQKIYRRVKVGKTAVFHELTIRAEGGGEFSIDAIIPWMRRAGSSRVFG